MVPQVRDSDGPPVDEDGRVSGDDRSEDEDTPRADASAPDTTGRRRGFPGWLVVTIATAVVVGVAVAEVLLQDRIGTWTDIALVAVAAISPLVTRSGDRSLPAMMPPLAFLAAVLVAGQWLVDPGETSWQTRELLMIGLTLGSNAGWVVAATIVAVTLATIRHLTDRHRRGSREEPARGPAPGGEDAAQSRP